MSNGKRSPVKGMFSTSYHDPKDCLSAKVAGLCAAPEDMPAARALGKEE